MRLPWGRILLAAFVVEVLYTVYVMVLLGAPERAYEPPGIIGAFSFMAVGGLWVGYKDRSNAILQGLLVGFLAHLLYMLLVLVILVATDITGPSLVPGLNAALKMLGGGVGGWAGALLNREPSPA